MVQTMETINVSFLTESERELILEVLQRDEKLRRDEEQRVRRLKAELVEIKRKGAKRGSGKYSQRTCGRCQATLGRLTGGGSQCPACKHEVCRNCRSVRHNASWTCSVCAKEAHLKKSTGDWFFDKRINRFSTAPGHDLVRVSLRKRPLPKQRETAGDALLKTPELTHSQTGPVPKPRVKDLVLANKSAQHETVEREPQRSDTESVERASQSSARTGTESTRSTPVLPRKGEVAPRSSPVGSTVSGHSTAVRSSSPHGPTPNGKTSFATHQLNPIVPESMRDVDGIFKKSVRRVEKISGTDLNRPTSTLDLREDRADDGEGSMGDRSKSVPGLNVQDEEEEDEDIDNLVNIHRRTLAESTTSLRCSTSTLGSMMSIYSEAGDYDTVEVSGDIMFSLSYDDKTQTLSVFVNECRNLAQVDSSRKKTNPYVKCYLLPDKSRQSKKKTAIKRNTINPSYNETLKYSISRSQLATRSLQLSVWHHDRFGRNAFLGEVEVPMDRYNLDLAHEECVALRGKATGQSPTSAFAQYKGELVISLKYVTAKTTSTDKTKGKKLSKAEDGTELHVLIKEARNLTAMKAGDTSDSFVKGYLLPAKSKSVKKKTPVVKKTLNPHYDHTLVYKDVTVEQLSSACLELTVWDREAMSSNDFLGGVRLSSGTVAMKAGKEEWLAESSREEVSLWETMMQYPDSWAEGTLPLRASMGKAK